MSIDLSRRSFLGGALAVTAAAALPSLPAFASLPTIHGDGVHDDTAGLQAALNGKPFRVERSGLAISQGGTLFLNRGVFRLTDTLVLGDAVRLVSTENYYDFSHGPPLDWAMTVRGDGHELHNDYIRGPLPGTGTTVFNYLHIGGRA